ncbi:hypothetical protein EYS14_12960 [Alteromonadaceae bacterium M269]|nr:hypothetical protein EYS14_12960 [Alteromonadaceae bacterium M269]
MTTQVADSHYASHLSELNQADQDNKVVLFEDVYNCEGKLVAAKEMEVTARVAEIIAKHKLAKPFESSVWIENGLSEQNLLHKLSKQLEEFGLKDLPAASLLLRDAKSACDVLASYPLVFQKLTVMSNQLPEIFNRTLLCSILSLGISRELELDEKTAENIFVANMISDVGMLHLPPELVLKEGEYTYEEWRMMQGHMAIAKHFADRVPGLPKIVGRAVLEHHERADGFGDPFGKTIDKLCIEGQVISMADEISMLYNRLVTNGHHSWNGVIDVIQVPTSAHSEVIRKAALRLLKKVKLPYKAKYADEQFNAAIDGLKAKHKCLNEWYVVISQILDLHKVELVEQNDFKPYTMLEELNRTIITSGLLSQFQLDWLQELSLPIDETTGFEIEEYELKLGEIESQCLFVMRKIRELRHEMAKRFHSVELAKHYYEELMDILKTD